MFFPRCATSLCSSSGLPFSVVARPNQFDAIFLLHCSDVWNEAHLLNTIFGHPRWSEGLFNRSTGSIFTFFRLWLTYQILISMDIIIIMNSISNTRHPPIPSNPSEFLPDGGSHADRVGGKWPCRHFWSPPNPPLPINPHRPHNKPSTSQWSPHKQREP